MLIILITQEKDHPTINNKYFSLCTAIKLVKYISTRASGYLHDSANVCVWLTDRMVRLLVPFLAKKPLALVGI
jgi:hypothetical protein